MGTYIMFGLFFFFFCGGKAWGERACSPPKKKKKVALDEMVAKYSPAFWECPSRYGLRPLYIVRDDPWHEPYLA